METTGPTLCFEFDSKLGVSAEALREHMLRYAAADAAMPVPSVEGERRGFLQRTPAGSWELTGLPSRVAGEDLQAWLMSLSFAREYAPVLTALTQAACTHPAQFGLVPGELTAPQEASLLVNYDADAVAHRAVMGHVRGTRSVDRGHVDVSSALYAPVGWFAPGVNPLNYGETFLYPRLWVNSEGSVTLFWRLGTVGRLDMSTELEVSWADGAEVENLAHAVLSSDREATMAMAVLTDGSATVVRDRNLQLMHEHTRDARAAFARPKDRVKPRLVTDVLESAWKESEDAHQKWWERSGARGWRVTNCTLNGTDIFGWQRSYGLENLHTAVGLSPAFHGYFSNYYADSDKPLDTGPQVDCVSAVDPWVAAVQEKLNRRNLGSILRVTRGRRVQFFVTMNVELFLRFHAAAGIYDSDTVELWDDGWSVDPYPGLT